MTVLFNVVYPRRSQGPYKPKKQKPGQYPAIMTEQAWSTENLLYGFGETFVAAERRQDGAVRAATHRAGFGSSLLLKEMAIN